MVLPACLILSWGPLTRGPYPQEVYLGFVSIVAEDAHSKKGRAGPMHYTFSQAFACFHIC